MNILIDELPEALDGVPINSDFRTWILFEELILDDTIEPLEKGLRALRLVYAGEPKSTARDAWAPLLWFYRCGKDPRPARERGAGGGPRAYDFEADAERIFSSFWQSYRIDLNDANLHWWKFRALLDGLPEDTSLSRAVYWRMVDTSKLKGEQLRNAKEKQKYYAIRDAALEKENDNVAAALMRGEDPGLL